MCMKNVIAHSVSMFILLPCLMIGAVSCSIFDRHRQSGVVAQVGNEQLTLSELDYITANATSLEDSAIMAEQYIRQWAGEILLYQKAKDRPIAKLETLVEDYRRSLYVHEFEQQLVARKMSQQVEDTMIAQFYAQHAEQFILRENIVKGVLLIFPKDAPHQKDLHKWLDDLDDEDNIESIEKYAYQFATGYEWFTTTWMTTNQILLRLPLETDILQQQLSAHTNCIEVSDSVSTYLLQVTDSYLAGESMPMDYASGEIKQLILSERQVTFLQQYQSELYNEAVRFGKVKLLNK